MPITLPSIEKLLPHRYGMLLVDRVLSWDESHAAVGAEPASGAWYAEPQGMPSWIGIELIAQAIAAHVCIVAWSKGEAPKRGVLLGARAFRATQSHFPAGARLSIKATKTFSDETGMGSYEGTIQLGKSEVATARVMVFEPPRFQTW